MLDFFQMIWDGSMTGINLLGKATLAMVATIVADF